MSLEAGRAFLVSWTHQSIREQEGWVVRTSGRWILFGFVLLAACAQVNAVKLAPESALPDFIVNADHNFQIAYRFAIANPDELSKYPCYCGCVYMDHMSNLDCYISEIGADGSTVFDNHAAGCGICVEITLDVIWLLNQGWESPQIRSYIDSHYGQRGPGTNTPLPVG
jgi:hypothetical protein